MQNYNYDKLYTHAKDGKFELSGGGNKMFGREQCEVRWAMTTFKDHGF